jgi:hypothetical protein
MCGLVYIQISQDNMFLFIQYTINYIAIAPINDRKLFTSKEDVVMTLLIKERTTCCTQCEKKIG